MGFRVEDIRGGRVEEIRRSLILYGRYKEDLWVEWWDFKVHIKIEVQGIFEKLIFLVLKGGRL